MFFEGLRPMAIPHSYTFEYEAEFTKEGFSDSEIVLHGSASSGENEVRLVGLNPMIRFWNGRLVLAAATDLSDWSRHRSSTWKGYTSNQGLRKSKNFLESLFADAWLEFNVQDKHLTLREREVSELGDYNIYVERCWQFGVPGTDECVSLCVADNLTMKIAAMRSAILLTHGDLKQVRWDVSEHFFKL
jgi:hypothetical protein